MYFHTDVMKWSIFNKACLLMNYDITIQKYWLTNATTRLNMQYKHLINTGVKTERKDNLT